MGRLRMNLPAQARRPTSWAAWTARSCSSPTNSPVDGGPDGLAARRRLRDRRGQLTYHTAILARSLHVPAVVGLHDASARIPAGANVAVDGSSGT